MTTDHDICYRALRSRDRRFDGRFFTGVTSTGIYCRPICPARTPKAENCVFFACAAAAEEAGFRACRRCRPETAPGTPAWCGTSATVSRAMRLIAEGALDRDGVQVLADRLGVGDRHLRRLFIEHLGASPLAIAHTRRAHLAKRLLVETDLPMLGVALASGFRNARRFNAAMRQSFAATPTEIRAAVRTGPMTTRDDGLRMKLSYRDPFDWQGLLDYLKPRIIPGVESIVGTCYERCVELGDFQGVIHVEADPAGTAALVLHVPAAASPFLPDIVNRVRAQFDLDADPDIIADHLARDRRLAHPLKRRPGLRVPGAWDRFELSIRAVLGQQVTVKGASRLSGRLVERFGRHLPEAEIVGDWSPTRLFPRADDLADAEVELIGVPGARAETIRVLARAVCEGTGVLDVASNLDECVKKLTTLPGVGDWTANYVAMRALNEPDAFPAGDLGLRKAMAVEGVIPSVKALTAAAQEWRPWRAYAAMLLWRNPERESNDDV